MKVIMTKGLPGSGKSTWAKQMLVDYPGLYKRLNKDELRLMLDNGKWSRNNEKFVLEQRDFLISAALIGGFSVIVDDTNLVPKHEERIKQLVDLHNNALASHIQKVTFEVKDFTDVPIEQCIKQDRMRQSYVGEKVIRDMYRDWLKPKPQVVQYNSALSHAVLCDLDGTLALFADDKQNPYDRDFSRDLFNAPVGKVVQLIQESLTKIVIVSGRKGEYQEMTEAWLKKHGVEYEAIFMRPVGDMRKDATVKQEIYEQHILGKYNVDFVLDDRNQVVDLWRSLGLTCLQVAPGDF